MRRIVVALLLLWLHADAVSWFCWKSTLADPASLQQLPVRTQRLFLSFNAREVAAFRESSERIRELRKYLIRVRKMGIHPYLLIGENSFAQPRNHTKLLALVALFEGCGFEGVVLDVEPPSWERESLHEWQNAITQLCAKVHRNYNTTRLLFVINHRLCSSKLLSRLAASGVSEVVVMYYSINEQRLVEKMHYLLHRHPALYFSLALSIEPVGILNADETFAGYPLEKSIRIWENIQKRLASYNNFSDIVIQSLYYFQQKEAQR